MKNTRLSLLRRRMAALLMTCALFQLPLSACDIGELAATTTTTTTLNTRDVIVALVNAAIVTPLQDLIATQVDNWLDNLLEEE